MQVTEDARLHLPKGGGVDRNRFLVRQVFWNPLTP